VESGSGLALMLKRKGDSPWAARQGFFDGLRFSENALAILFAAISGSRSGVTLLEIAQALAAPVRDWKNPRGIPRGFRHEGPGLTRPVSRLCPSEKL